MKKPPNLLFPRIAYPFGACDGCKDPRPQRALNEAFRAEFTASAMADTMNQAFEKLSKRGWRFIQVSEEHGDWVKDGVRLTSVTAWEIDRIAKALHDAIQAQLDLYRAIQDASPSELLAVRLAWRAGMLRAESKAYETKALGAGRKSTKQYLYDIISKATDAWRRENPKTTRDPRPSELYALAIGTRADITLPGKAAFANRVSEWRKIHRKRSGEDLPSQK